MGALEDLKKRQSRKDKRAAKGKPSYKDIHGTSRVGDILRKLGKTETLGKILNVAGEIATGDWAGAVGIITNSKELTAEDKEVVLKELERDIIESQEITKRWEADMNSDSWMSKNARPIALFNMLLMFDIVIIAALFDRELMNEIIPLAIPNGYITLFTSAFLTVLNGYFVLRTIEKRNKNKYK